MLQMSMGDHDNAPFSGPSDHLLLSLHNSKSLDTNILKTTEMQMHKEGNVPYVKSDDTTIFY